MQVRFAGANRQSPACFDPSVPGLSVGCQSRQTLLFQPEIVMAHSECLVINRLLKVSIFFRYFTKHFQSYKPQLLTGNIG